MFFKDQQEPIIPADIYKKIKERRLTGAILSFGIKGGKTVKKTDDKYVFFEHLARFLRAIQSFSKINKIELIFFKDDKSDLIFSIFLKDRLERFDHGQSFRKINKSNSITVDLF